MSHRVLRAGQAIWRPSNSMDVDNTNLATALDAKALGARLWRLRPGQASTWHLDPQEELYLLLAGTGRMRVEDATHTLDPFDAVLVDPATPRQIFNDTRAEALWLVVGAPSEDDDKPEEWTYPDGKTALPPELGGGHFGGGGEA